jgi:multiple sugar transport system permease protein
VVPPSFVPWPPNFDAFVYVLQNSPFIRWYINTIVVSVTVTFFCILFALMCAYALSQLDFKGRRLIYTALLVGFMLPFSALAVPLFMMMNQFSLVNTFAGLILPQIAVPLPVIVFKQFFDEVPRDFRDAALIDGAGNWRILFRIYLPLNWNITWAMSIVTFISTWNNFFWPLIVYQFDADANYPRWNDTDPAGLWRVVRQNLRYRRARLDPDCCRPSSFSEKGYPGCNGGSGAEVKAWTNRPYLIS